MIDTPQFIFFRLQKCASRTLGEYFKKEFNSPSKVRGTHIECRKMVKNKLWVCSIRNPWDWNVSNYYCCANDKRFESIRFKNGKPLSFKEFLIGLYNKKSGKVPTIHFNTTSSLNIGAYTWRYLNMCYSKDVDSMTPEDLKNPNLLKIDYFIRQEKITEGIQDLYKQINYTPTEINLSLFNKTATRGHYRDYYDDELRELVMEKEKVIIEKFNYKY